MYVNSIFAGAATGSLGRHSQISTDGMPVFDERFVVLFKVSTTTIKLVHLMVRT